MIVHFGIGSLTPEWNSCVVCMGTFDGVHIGHRQVIRAAADEAKALGVPCVVVTFDRNPAAVLAPDRCPPFIADLASNLEEIAKCGVAAVIVLPFDRAFSETTADQFLIEFLLNRIHASAAVVGHDFTFGKDRQGTPEWLGRRLATIIVPPFLHDGVRVSSSQIRTALMQGEVEAAAELLGRPFSISGVVVRGQQLGRTIGYPTINIARSLNQVTPKDGVYAGFCVTPVGRYKAAISIGVRPTVEGPSTIEAYLLDFAGGELYGYCVELSVCQRLRDQQKFDSLQELKAQIASDVDHVSRVN